MEIKMMWECIENINYTPVSEKKNFTLYMNITTYIVHHYALVCEDTWESETRVRVPLKDMKKNLKTPMESFYYYKKVEIDQNTKYKHLKTQKPTVVQLLKLEPVPLHHGQFLLLLQHDDLRVDLEPLGRTQWMTDRAS